ncbi:hypothetical protein GFS24_28370 [Chitinophaga sp. SYP-B3965]|uniref:hypothetical protein n=1 Tax=Chitinophaga sp. SYP-B3965 TaxID=2663120 RepID=UPI001299C8DE|nr:hypothetical protein [Chitinophaga sp. SYP-B3965]MRG49058.1 hypothetical protein [Chitinophaga sp. SYP-B3965]
MNEQQHLDTLTDIKRIMERSTRFISLSGLGGVGAGISALVGAYFAWNILEDRSSYDSIARGGGDLLVIRLLMIAGAVLVAALSAGFYFTWKKARRQGLPVWDAAARKVFFNLMIPLGAGGLFIFGLLYNNQLALVAPSCLVFYGLALVNASKYTVTDIRYLGYAEIILGILALFNLYHGLLFWALGFGVMHIIYGTLMWWKYERVPAE